MAAKNSGKRGSAPAQFGRASGERDCSQASTDAACQGGRSYNTRKFLKKLGARLASPQPRPASPVNGAGGITGCGKDAQAFGSFQPGPAFFQIFSRPLFVSEMAYF
jgi:hypothetical protein